MATPTPSAPLKVVALTELTSALQRQMASGSPVTDAIVWTDGDSEVVIHPSLTKVALQLGLVLVEVRLVTDQSGAAPVPLVVPLSVGRSADDGALTAVTEDV